MLILGCVVAAGCGGDGADGGAEKHVRFQDPNSSFATEIVYDVTRETMTFDVGTSLMTFQNDLQFTGFDVDGLTLTADDFFMVNFGFEAGEQRAYFTETATGTICDVMVTPPDTLSIRRTNELPPQQ